MTSSTEDSSTSKCKVNSKTGQEGKTQWFMTALFSHFRSETQVSQQAKSNAEIKIWHSFHHFEYTQWQIGTCCPVLWNRGIQWVCKGYHLIIHYSPWPLEAKPLTPRLPASPCVSPPSLSTSQLFPFLLFLSFLFFLSLSVLSPPLSSSLPLPWLAPLRLLPLLSAFLFPPFLLVTSAACQHAPDPSSRKPIKKVSLCTEAAAGIHTWVK